MQSIEKLLILESETYNPYHNLAVEEYMLNTLPSDTAALYLWQNANTVVIGRNQNSFIECNIDELSKDGGFLARRLSGGGAVFHDLGNLNFTFIMKNEHYNVQKQLKVVTEAVNFLSVSEKSYFTGRNDIEIEGKKFSGNAFYKGAANSYHHGTLLFDTDIDNLGKYLNVSQSKLKSKGVKSVKSRVTNLKNFMPNENIDSLKKALITSFSDVYGLTPTFFSLKKIYSDSKFELLHKKYSSNEFIYNMQKPVSFELSERFPWGGVIIHFVVENNFITDCDIFTDSMDTDSFEEISKKIIGQHFSFKDIHDTIVEPLKNDVDDSTKTIYKDIANLILKN